MSTGDQQEVVEFLSRAGAFGAGRPRAEREETHISIIFLTADRAFKLKRAVRFPYLDFSTPERRRAACEAEVAINRRTAPAMYLGVVAVTRDAAGGLALGGAGEPVDWLVEMIRFDREKLFDRLARRGGLDRHLMEALAETLATFHEQAEIRPAAGGSAGTAAIVKNIGACFAEIADPILDGARVATFNALAVESLAGAGDVLDVRRSEGRVRRCHGDLHLRNIFLMDGVPTLFDAIEFTTLFTDIDVLYDLAFLVMDLDHHDLRRLSNVVFNRYLDITADGDGLAVLPLFLSMRAAIRSHVAAATLANIPDRGQARARRDETRQYLEMAIAYLAPPSPRLIAVGGLSGSGKSRMARELAPHVGAAPGARVVRSDVIRKNLSGVDTLTRLGPEGYTPEMTARTFGALFEQARAVLATGHSVIADAVFAHPDQRHAIADVAARAGVPFRGLWLEAPEDVREARVTSRRRNVSDATAEIVRMQRAYDPGEITWSRVDSAGTREDTVAAGLDLL